MPNQAATGDNNFFISISALYLRFMITTKTYFGFYFYYFFFSKKPGLLLLKAK